MNNADDGWIGPVAALRFLSLPHCEGADWVAVSIQLYKGQTADEIFERARKNWPE